MSTVKPIPDGSSVVIPMLVCRDAGAELEFCKTAFGAAERGRRPGPDGAVAHALITIGDAMIIVEAEWPTLGNLTRLAKSGTAEELALAEQGLADWAATLDEEDRS